METSSSTNENRPAAEKTLAPAKESGGESREEKAAADRKETVEAVRDESTDARLEGEVSTSLTFLGLVIEV